MRKYFYLVLLFVLTGALASSTARAQIFINEGPACNFTITPNSQDFQTLNNPGGGWINNNTLPGWYLSDPAALQPMIDDGSSNAGGFYIYDDGTGTDLALGTLPSNATDDLYIGLRIVNNSSKHIYSILWSYNGEQWRRGENDGNINGYNVYWKTFPTGTPLATIETIPTANPPASGFTLSTDISAPYPQTYRYEAMVNSAPGLCTGPGMALNGNLNTQLVGFALFDFSAAPLEPGGELMILFEDLNDPCTDHGIAIDDINFSNILASPFKDTLLDPVSGPLVVCQNTTATYSTTGAPAGSFVDWSSNMPPAQFSIVNDSTDNAQFVFNNVTPGTYNITASPASDCGPGGFQESITISVEAQPANANAGIDQIFCSRDSTRLFGNTAAPDFGQWNFIGGPVTPNIVSPTNATTDVLNMTVPGLYEFEWRITKASCGVVTSDVVLVDVQAPPSPANAGADASFCNQNTLMLTGNAPAVGETSAWNYVSPGAPPPSAPVVVNTGGGMANALAVTPGFSYSFEYVVSKPGCGDTRDTVTYTVGAPTTVAFAGLDQSICAVGTFTLSGNAINPATESANWTFVSGPAAPVITPVSATDAEVSGFPATGTYVFRYEITNSPCPATNDDVALTTTLPPAPAPNGGGDQFLCGTTSITLNGNPVTNGTNSWRFYNTTTATTPTITQVGNDLNVTGMTENGVYRFIYSFQNPPCTALEDTVEVTVSDQTVPGTVTGGTEFCGPNFVTLNLSGNLGQVLRWEKSTDNFATVTNIANTTTILVDAISQTTQYRAVVQNPGCGIEVTNRHLIRIDQPTQAGTLDFFQYSNNSICGSNIVGVFYLTGTIGNVVQWEYSTDNFATVDTIALPQLYLNVPTDLPNPLIGATKFRAVLKSGICPEVRSNEFEILPTVQGLDLTLTGMSGCDGYGAIMAEASNGSGVYDYFISPSAGYQQSPGMFNYVPENITYTVYARDRNTLCYTQQTITLTPGTLAPPMVTGATSVTSTAATLNWTAVPGFGVTYEVRYRQTGPGHSWVVLSPTSSTSRRVNGLTPGVRYVYRVRAICRDGSQSALSDVAGVAEARFTTVAGRESIADAQSALQDLSVYPNPNNGAFTLNVSSETSQSASFTLTDVAGKEIFAQTLEITAGANEIPVQLNGAAAGVYILRYQQGKNVRAVKLIVE